MFKYTALEVTAGQQTASNPTIKFGNPGLRLGKRFLVHVRQYTVTPNVKSKQLGSEFVSNKSASV